jgi:hypothetical protein
MNEKRSFLRALLAASAVVVLPLLLAQCGREELTVNVWGTFDVVREVGRNDVLHVEGRAYEPRVSHDDFKAVWDAVSRTGSGDGTRGVALTLAGGSDTDPAGVSVLTGMVLVIPLPLARNASYPVTRTNPPPSATDMPMYWERWGEHALAQPGEAEIALRVFDYHTIGMQTHNDFIATGVTGTVRVLSRQGEHVEFRLDITATDAAGSQLVLRGDFSAAAERYTPPIT